MPNEIAIIFKKKIDSDGNIEFMPIKAAEGTYSESENIFIDKEGTPYHHIIENPNNYGFAQRCSIDNYKKAYPLLTLQLIERIVLNMAKKYTYTYNIEQDTNAPLILYIRKNNDNDMTILFDEDIKRIYQEKYPAFSNLYLKEEENIKKEEKTPSETINVNQLYTKLTSKIIDQEEPIRKILTAIWKQQSGLTSSNAKNILINGSTAVGKTEIINILIKELNIPCHIAVINPSELNYNTKIIETMLFELLKVANYDIEKASKGILIIDKIERITSNYILEGEILRLLDGNTFKVSLKTGEQKFDTSALTIICVGNLDDKNKMENRTVGFEQNQIKLKNRNSELLSKFSTVIEMNNLTTESFIKILKSEHGLLNANRKFLLNKGVKLRIKNGTMKEIADKTSNANHGVRSLNEIIETALSVASFEIATNPKLYSELIISPDTINDNKKYTLVKKSNN